MKTDTIKFSVFDKKMMIDVKAHNLNDAIEAVKRRMMSSFRVHVHSYVEDYLKDKEVIDRLKNILK